MGGECFPPGSTARELARAASWPQRPPSLKPFLRSLSTQMDASLSSRHSPLVAARSIASRVSERVPLRAEHLELDGRRQGSNERTSQGARNRWRPRARGLTSFPPRSSPAGLTTRLGMGTRTRTTSLVMKGSGVGVPRRLHWNTLQGTEFCFGLTRSQWALYAAIGHGCGAPIRSVHRQLPGAHAGNPG